jgi:hypothetical protein
METSEGRFSIFYDIEEDKKLTVSGMMGMGLGLLSWDICAWRLSTEYFMISKKIKNLQ